MSPYVKGIDPSGADSGKRLELEGPAIARKHPFPDEAGAAHLCSACACRKMRMREEAILPLARRVGRRLFACQTGIFG
jgi:hypothetical protein